jgi:hypothetical protein
MTKDWLKRVSRKLRRSLNTCKLKLLKVKKMRKCNLEERNKKSSEGFLEKIWINKNNLITVNSNEEEDSKNPVNQAK